MKHGSLRLRGFVLCLAVSLLAGSPPTMDLVDFADPDVARGFFVVNDDVMGGVSTSRVHREGDALVFEGTVRLENGGGFASMRGPILPGAPRSDRDLREAQGIEVVVRGDGASYKLTLRADPARGDVVHRASFGTRAGEAKTIRLPFEAFEAWRRGRRLADAPPLDRSDVREVGLLVSEKQAGDFRIEILAIRAFR